MQDDISGWSDWQAAFGHIDELASPSELHGLMMGLLCVVQAPTELEWQHVIRMLEVKPFEAPALRLLTEEAEDAAAALEDDSLDYMPMLPDDQHSLAERVSALADWCNGVVLGFGLSSSPLRTGEEEQLQDMQDIAAVEFEAADDDEEGEASYADLVEFARLIPVSLALGRKKVPIAQLPMFTANNPMQSAHVVEMFAPKRPS